MIKSYDFKSPKKLTKERMSTMENLYDSFARAPTPYPTGLLWSSYEVNVNGIMEKRYQKFSSPVQDHSLFGMTTMSPASEDHSEAPLTMEMDTKLAFSIIERLLGGVGSEYDLSRDFADIEKAILQYALKKTIEFLGEAWGQYLDTEASLTEFQTNPHLLQVNAQGDVVIQVGLEVVIEKSRVRINMVMSAPNVEELTPKFGYSFTVSHKKQDKDKQKSKRHYIKQHLLGSEVELRAILYESVLDAQGIPQFVLRDVVPLNKEVDSAVPLYMEDMACFEVRADQTKMRKAVEVSGELQSGGKGMLSMDKEAIGELMETEAVLICNVLGSLLGRSMKMSVLKVEEIDMGSLAEGLLRSNVAIENRRAVGGMSADQLYIFAREDMIKLTSYIMGVPTDAQSPLDEIVLNTLKEIAPQCVGATMGELSDSLGGDMRDTIIRISAFDNTERIQDVIHS